MEEKVLFESKGGAVWRQICYVILGLIFCAMSVIIWRDLLEKMNSRFFKPEMKMWILAILITALGVFCLYMAYASAKSYLRVYENYIEAQTINLNYLRMLIDGGGSKTSKVVLNFDEIKGVSSSKGMIVLETLGKTQNIFCKDCAKAEEVISRMIKTHKTNRY